MRVAGVVVSMRGPEATVVVLEGSPTEPQLLEILRLTTNERDIADQAHDMALNLRNSLRALNLDAVILRRADRPPRPSNAEGPRMRLILEGALISAAKEVVGNSSIATGREAGQIVGVSKARLDSMGEAIADDAGQAAAGALAALARSASDDS